MGATRAERSDDNGHEATRHARNLARQNALTAACASLPSWARSPPGRLSTEPPLRIAALATLVAATAIGGVARAADYEVDLETIGQGYQVAAGDNSLLDRRRLDQYLGLNIWNLGPKDALGVPLGKNQFYFSMSLRIEHDFGNWGDDPNFDPAKWGGRDISQELRQNRSEILYAYIGAKDLFGFVDAKLGRQLSVDQFEYLAYDGLSLELKTPYWFAVDVYGGLLVNGALPVDSPIFRPDGTAPGAFSPHDQDYKPLLGVSLRSFGFRDLDAQLSYRHVWSPAQNSTPDELQAGATDGTTEETVSWSARGRLLGGKIVPWFGLRYNLLVHWVDTIQGGVRFLISPTHSLQAEYVYSYPTFDGDSIWNLFVHRRFDDVRVGYDLRKGPLRGYARFFLRFFDQLDGECDRVSTGTTGRCATNAIPLPSGGTLSDRLDWGGDLGARIDGERGFIRLDAYVEAGYGGTKIGVDAAARMKIYKDLVGGEGRLTYVHWVGDQNFIDSHGNSLLSPVATGGDSFGVSLGARLVLARGILLHLLVEDNINQFYTSALRAYALLDISFVVGRKGISLTAPQGIGPGLGGFGNPLGTGMGY